VFECRSGWAVGVNDQSVCRSQNQWIMPELTWYADHGVSGIFYCPGNRQGRFGAAAEDHGLSIFPCGKAVQQSFCLVVQQACRGICREARTSLALLSGSTQNTCLVMSNYARFTKSFCGKYLIVSCIALPGFAPSCVPSKNSVITVPRLSYLSVRYLRGKFEW